MGNRSAAILIILIGCLTAAFSVLSADPNPESDSRYLVEKLQLTSEEEAWIQAHPVIRVSGPKSFPPFHYFDEQGNLQGMALDYLMALSSMVGIKVKIQNKLPWHDVLSKIRNKELDVISCLSYSENREQFISYSNPYLSFPLVIITRKDYEFIGGQEDLHGRRVACIKGNIVCEWLTRDNIKFISYTVTSQLEALESVSLGRADIYVGNLAAVSYQIENRGLANLKVAAPTNFGNYHLHIGVRKDWPELTAIFNRALKRLNPETQIEFRSRWVNAKYDYGIRVADAARWGIIALTIGVLILGGFIAWNRRLSLEIEKREQITASLKQETDFNKAVLRWVHTIVLVLDEKGKIILFNNAAETCSGYTFDEVRDVPYWEVLISQEDRERVRSRTDDVSAQAVATRSINHWVTKSGEKRLIQWLNSPLMGADGEETFVLSTGLDITEQRQAEESSANDRQKLAHALSATGASIWEWNLKTGEIHIGAEIVDHLGYEKEDLTLTPEGLTRIVDEESALAFASLVDFEQYDDTQTRTIEVKARSKSGDWHWLRSQTRVYRWDSENQPEVLLGSLLDITEAKKTQEVIIQTEKMMSVGGLAAGMAHELNNPLGAMLMGLQNVERRLDPENEKNRAPAKKHGVDLNALQNYLRQQNITSSFTGIRDAGLRAAEIITNMLQFSRTGDSRRDAVELPNLLNKTLQLAETDFNLKRNVDFKQVKIVKEFDTNLPPVLCVESEISQVVLNLMLNAFQAVSGMGDNHNGQLRLSITEEQEYAVIQIQDNGPGMQESVRKRIFEPFFTTKSKGEGTGLGLSVAYMIITSHHMGSIDVTSTPGEGTCFTIKLPFNYDPA